MLSAEDFFAVCAGQWQTDRVYHYPRRGEVERSYTEFNAETLTSLEKHQISSSFIPLEFFKSEVVDQIRVLPETVRLRTIITYQRPAAGKVPTDIILVGFGLERREE
jgi:hypothetical protein